MRRRAFLEGAALLAIGTATGSSAAAADAVRAHSRLPVNSAVLLADRLLHAYPLKRSLAALGGVYWQDAASTSDVCELCLPVMMDGFLQHLDLAEAVLEEMPPAAIRDRVRSGNAADFSMGRIVPVRGWILGETEARLCAIAALRTA